VSKRVDPRFIETSSRRSALGRAAPTARLACCALLALVLGGCAGRDFVYHPVQHGATLEGLPATAYRLPSSAPTGTVSVASLGVETLATEDGPVPVLRTRFSIANEEDELAWALDVREVTLDLGAAGAQRPAFVNARVDDLPRLVVERGEQRTVDVFFWLPATSPDAASLPSFHVVWEVKAGVRHFATRTAFRRAEPAEARAWPREIAYSPYWWYDRAHHGSSYHLGGPFDTSWYPERGHSAGGSWLGLPTLPTLPVLSPHRVPALPRPATHNGSPVRGWRDVSANTPMMHHMQ
jgi:hypothetical protein